MLQGFSESIFKYVIGIVGISAVNIITWVVMPIHSSNISVEWVVSIINIILWAMILYPIIRIIAILSRKKQNDI